MPISFSFNAAALRSIAIAGAEQDLRVRANRVLNAARRGAPVDTGRLRSSLAVEFSTNPGGLPVARIGSNLPYAVWVHEGTGLYGPRGQMITPRSARFMVWPVTNNNYVSTGGPRRFKGGATAQYAFAKQTRGMRGRPFLLSALDAAK